MPKDGQEQNNIQDINVNAPIPIEIHDDENVVHDVIFQKTEGRITAPAATEFAKLVGKDNLIVHTEKGNTEINGQSIGGIFQKKGNGEKTTDVNFANVHGKDAFDHSQMFSDMASISVLDYIFGTQDRKANEATYCFDEAGEKKLVGFTVDNKGIDTSKSADESDLDAIPVIGQILADIILLLKKEQVLNVLKDNELSAQEADVVWNKVEKLQNAIQAGKEHYRDRPEGELDKGFIRVVPEDSFGAYKLDQLSKGNNFFQAVQNLPVKEEALSQENNAEKKYENPKVVFQNKITSPDTIRVKLSDSKDSLKKAQGGAMSERFPVRFKNAENKTVDGFFTAQKTLNEVQNTIKVCMDYAKANPQYADFFYRFGDYVRQINKKYSPTIVEFDRLGYTKEEEAALRSDPNFSVLINRCTNDIGKTNISINSLVGMYKADRTGDVDKRNIAMSNVAELYGVPNLLAKSVPMEMQIDGNIVRGTFMEKADGTDVEDLRAQDAMVGYGMEVYDKSPGLKSLADLQIIDYICLNTDRHGANMMYHFSNDNPPKFLGVTGIDNDNSFGTMDFGEGIYGYGSLAGINVISESMAEHIRNVTREELYKAVQIKGLSEKEAEASWKRVLNIKERVDSGRIRTIKDDEWEKTTLDELCVAAEGDEDNVSIFTTVKKQIEDLNRLAEMKANQPKRNIEYAQTEVVETFDEEAALNDIVKEQEEIETERFDNDAQAEADKVSADEKSILTDEELFQRLKTESARMLTEVSRGEHWYKSKPAEYKALTEKVENLNNKIKTLDKNLLKGDKLKKDDVSNLMTDLSGICAGASEFIYSVADKENPSVDDLRRQASSRNIREASIKFYDGFEKNAHKRELSANPVIHAYDALKEEKEIASKFNPANEADRAPLKSSLARQIYYKAVTRNALKLRQTKGINVALKREIVEKNVEKIMKSPVFQEMTNSEQKLSGLKNKAINGDGSGVYKEFIKNAANKVGAEKLNELKQVKEAQAKQAQAKNNMPVK